MGKTIAAYGGGFKPPTKGHLEVVKKALDAHPEIDEFIIYVGGKERDGISQTESLLIWDIFKKYLPMKVKIEPSKLPIGDIIRLGKNNPDDKVYFIIGGREGRQDDLDDITNRTKNIEQAYSNMEVKVQTTPDKGMSGTNARKASKISSSKLSPFLPDELNNKEKEEVFNILRPVIKEEITNVIALQEGRYDQEVLMQSRFIMNLFKPNLGNKFIEEFEGQLEDIYYDLELKFIPSSFDELGPIPFIVNAAADEDSLELIITYQPDSFPDSYNDLNAEIKDALRHELEHIGQFNFNKGVNPAGSDDLKLFDYLTLDYEIPAFVQGLYKKSKTKKITLNQAIDDFLDERLEELTPGEIKKIKQVYLNWAMKNLPKAQITENASYTKDINLIEKLAQLTQHMLDKGMNVSPLPKLEFINGDNNNASDFFGKTAYYNPNTQTIVLYTEGRHPKDIARSYAHEMIHHIQNIEGRLGNIQTTNTQEDDHLNNIEAEANLKGTMTFRNWTDSLNEEIVGEKIECDNCGWSWKIAEGGNDLFICHKCNHNNTPVNESKPYKHKHGFNKKLGKDPFGLNQFAREIAEGVLLPEEEIVSSQPMKYKIYSDMDGVLTDFDKSFEKYSKGIPPREYEKKFGKDGFWKLIDGEGKVGFWVGMPWMEDGKQYWDYIKNYDVELLSSPSRSETSRLGKRLWVRNNLPGIKLHLAQAYNKKNYAEPNHILIDDRESNIEQWKEAGGVGILHKNANDTIKQLKALGL